MQLFARLGHAEPCVRTHVRTLITHIGGDLPDAIIYPTVVGLLENPSSRQLSSILDFLRGTQFTRFTSTKVQILTQEALLVSCESTWPGLVAEVQQLIRELNRCSILREDLVWGVLQVCDFKLLVYAALSYSGMRP